MNRDEAIEAGARALYERAHSSHRDGRYPWGWAIRHDLGHVDVMRADAAAVLDAIGWHKREIALEAQDRAVATLHEAGHVGVTRRDLQRAIGRLLPGWVPAVEPVGYVVAIDDTDFPGAIYGGGAWRTVEEALKYVDSGERVWGIVPVDIAEVK